MFADLDETIRELLIHQVPLDVAEVDISFDAPDREWSGRLTRPTINCFLYDVRQNVALSEVGWEGSRTEAVATRRKRPMRVDASYQVTAWARAPEDEHRLLWRILHTLARNPVLPSDVAHGSVKEQPFPLPARVARPEPQARLSPADLWQALDNRIRPSLSYVVTLALESDVVDTSPLVFTRVLRTGLVNGQDRTESVEIAGVVRSRANGHELLAGARVTLRETGASGVTDSDGRFTFSRVPRGSVTLIASGPEGTVAEKTVEVPAASYDVEV